MKRNALSIIALICFALGLTAQINDIPRSTPEAQGISSKSISDMLGALMNIPDTEIHHVMVLRNGNVVAEMHPAPYKAEYKHTQYSLSKTFVSLAIGIAIDENRLRLTDRIAPFFTDELPDTISDNLARLTVRDLLIMGSGMRPDWDMRNNRSDWAREYLSRKVGEPGAEFLYDSITTYMLSEMVQRATGMKTLDFLRQRLFSHMNISDIYWQESPTGVNTGGWGLHIQCEAIAKIGLLYLNKGKWNGEQLVSEEWIAESSKKHADNSYGAINPIPTDGNSGYGYQIRMCKYPGAYRADGAYGQFMVAVPDKNIVVVINGLSIGRTDDELDAIWNMLLPGVSDNTLPENKQNHAKMSKLCSEASLKFPEGAKFSTRLKRDNDIILKLDDNKRGIDTLKLRYAKDRYILTVVNKDGTVDEIPFGYKNWLTTTSTTFPPYSVEAMGRFKGLKPEFTLGSAYAWKDRNTMILQTHYTNFISSRMYEIHFMPTGIEVKVKENYSVNNTETIKAILQF